MPAVAGSDLYIQSSVLSAVELRGVTASALRTGDLAFLTSTKQFYYLDKASFAADDSVNVIATRESITATFPLGDPTIPGRWILGPCASCGTGVTFAAAPMFSELAVNTSTGSAAFVPIGPGLGVAAPFPAGVSIEIQADLSGSSDTANAGGAIGIFIDGVFQRGAALSTSATGRSQTAAITLKRPVVAGIHTIELRWHTIGGGVIACNPVGAPNTDHASLYVRQVNT